jgi:hypothetical protein
MVCGTPVLAFNRSASQESLHPLASHLVLLHDDDSDDGDSVADGVTNGDDDNNNDTLITRRYKRKRARGGVAGMASAIISAFQEPLQRFNWTSDSLAVASQETLALVSPRNQAKMMLRALNSIKNKISKETLHLYEI